MPQPVTTASLNHKFECAPSLEFPLLMPLCGCTCAGGTEELSAEDSEHAAGILPEGCSGGCSREEAGWGR
jgi:hypothetical protein